MSDVVHVTPASELRGSIRVPGDKSTSHRALMLSALAEGDSVIRGLSRGEDVAATSAIMVQLGALRRDEEEVVYVTGPPGGLRATSEALDCGNSGTTMRLLCGLVLGINGAHRLVGDASLSSRPMDRVATPLREMGARITGAGERVNPPLEITTDGNLRAISYSIPVASAQVKSAILLAGLYAQGVSEVTESVRTRTNTEDMLQRAGVEVVSVEEGNGRRISLVPSRPQARTWHVPGDPSQAAFFAVLGAVHRDASLEILSLDNAPERVGFVSVLARMGANVDLHPRDGYCSLTSRSSDLLATEIHSREIPSVDEVPALAVAAAGASGVSAFRDMAELRVKESDRFTGSMDLAAALGCRVWSDGDDFFIEGLGSSSAFNVFSSDALLDHRLVMASAIAGCAGRGCDIDGASTVATSYPHFFRDLALLG